jgi:hypothetical protein
MHAALMRACGVTSPPPRWRLITLLVCYDVVGRNLGLRSLAVGQRGH